ncbi:MAG TPA: hypothetical protein VIV60_08490 [Polyangiaceae bacterium]
MTNFQFQVSSLFTCSLLCACNVDSPPGSTGGVHLVEQGRCERALVVVMTDYSSTNVGITELDGTPRSPSFISSAAAKPGLALALSGDVDAPRTAPASGRVVLLDRFGKNVVTWLDPTSAEVLAQLPVGTGFESNPQDYLEYQGHWAMVSRFGSNPHPGQQAYDAGGDLLILDTDTPAIVDRIAMPEEDPNLLPRPSGMTQLSDTIVVSLGRLSADFHAVGSGRFVGVSPESKTLLWTVDIDGVKNCGRLALSPSGKLGAIACSSQFDSVTYRYNPDESDVVLFDMTVTPPVELRRLGLGKTLDAGLQPTLEFASESKLIALTYGGNATTGDRAVAVDAEVGTVQSLFQTTKPYSVSGVHCAPGCGDVCVISDAESGNLHRYRVSATGEFTALEDVKVDDSIGLPPHAIGAI